jgi:hypothetical protein
VDEGEVGGAALADDAGFRLAEQGVNIDSADLAGRLEARPM